MEESEEVFEISDFTVATEWERVIARLETFINEWNLASKERSPYNPYSAIDLQGLKWHEKSGEIEFGGQKLRIFYYRASNPANEAVPYGLPDYLPHFSKDVMYSESDWCPPVPSPLVRWFGLQEFLMLMPFCSSDIMTSESRRNMILSACSVALGSCNCDLPMFVQVHKEWRQLYFGLSVSPSVRTQFDMAHLKYPPGKLKFLAGLLEAFKAKLNCPAFPLPPVKVSISLCYQIEEGFDVGWSQSPPDLDVDGPQLMKFSELGKLPFGACQDSVSSLHLFTSWSCIHEDMIIENDIYSDLDPLSAPQWRVKANFVNDSKGLMSDLLSTFLDLFSDNTAVSAAIDIPDREFGDVNVSNALERLTEPVVPEMSRLGGLVSKVAQRAVKASSSSTSLTHQQATGGSLPIDSEDLQEFLNFLFPDAVTPEKNSGSQIQRPTVLVARNSKLPHKTALPGKAVPLSPSEVTSDDEFCSQDDFTNLKSPVIDVPFSIQGVGIENETAKFKAAPANSLTSRIALALVQALNSVQGRKAVCQLWHEIILELRYRWSNGIPLPLLEEGHPDLNLCSLHQDLQMLNCCIRHKILRQTKESEARSSGDSLAESEGELSNSGDQRRDFNTSYDEEFYDCIEDRETIWSNNSPAGRMDPFKDIKLLDKPEMSLYIPETQDPSPITEGMLAEQASVLTQLGTNKDASILRARMQSASLLSDMQSFKAANPGCKLEDFVRWFSPRDWVVDASSGKGHLSQRMSVPGNMWHDVWNAAKPIAAARQKRLFDDTKEAEKILHRLSSITVSGFATLIAPVLFVHAHSVLVEEAFTIKAVLKDKFAELVEKLISANKYVVTQYSYGECLRTIREIETAVSRYRALKSRFQTTPVSSSPSSEADNSDSLPPTSDSNLYGASLTRRPIKSPPAHKEDSNRLSSDGLHEFLVSLLFGSTVGLVAAARGRFGQQLLAMLSRNNQSKKFSIDSNDDSPVVTTPRDLFPQPKRKEYILRASMPRPKTYSRVTAQRLYAAVTDDEFRLAVMTAEDSTFF